MFLEFLDLALISGLGISSILNFNTAFLHLKGNGPEMVAPHFSSPDINAQLIFVVAVTGTIHFPGSFF